MQKHVKIKKNSIPPLKGTQSWLPDKSGILSLLKSKTLLIKKKFSITYAFPRDTE